jgi:hypothetical protein
VIDHNGRANVSMTQERNKLLLALEGAKSYRDYISLAGQLDKLPADLGEGVGLELPGFRLGVRLVTWTILGHQLKRVFSAILRCEKCQPYSGGDEWRRNEESDAYDAALCRIYLTVMRQAREGGDAGALGLALRTVLHRNFAGIDRLLRLRHARAGTKTVAEEFVCELCRSIRFLAAAGTPAYDQAVGSNGGGGGGGGGGSGGGGGGGSGVGGGGLGGVGRVSAGDTPHGGPGAGRGSSAGAGRMDSPRGVPLGGLGYLSRLGATVVDARVPEMLRLISEAHRSLVGGCTS